MMIPDRRAWLWFGLGYISIVTCAVVFVSHATLAFGPTRQIGAQWDVVGVHGILLTGGVAGILCLSRALWILWSGVRQWHRVLIGVVFAFPGFVSCWIGLYAVMISFNLV